MITKRNCSLFFVLFCFLVCVPNIIAGWFGPDNFEECIQINQKKSSSKLAARAIHLACTKKFTEKTEIEYANCIIEHVGNTASDLGVRAIVEACANIYISGKDKKYSKCILRNMPGIEVDMAARSIAISCRNE
ncbi:MAG: hypothetical protein HQK78_17685 [Desulfobacterales bacterium]|nr:hypothetical protein [Desulfobacterales bacterium]